jgi:hypothetical protein
MKKPTEEQIRQIAETLDVGMKCYFNKTTGEIHEAVDSDRWPDSEESLEDEGESIDLENGEWVEFEKMTSDDEFRVMADFAENCASEELRRRLIAALNRPKPFRNFKSEIDAAGEIRDQWFKYKNRCYADLVEKQVKCLFDDEDSQENTYQNSR